MIFIPKIDFMFRTSEVLLLDANGCTSNRSFTVESGAEELDSICLC